MPITPATVKAAWITGIFLIIVGVITLIGVIYSSNKTSDTGVNATRLEQELKDKSEVKKKKLQSFDDAISSIQEMKASISKIFDNPNITYSEATKIVEKSSQALTNAYGGNSEANVKSLCMDVCGTCNSNCPLHKAKDTGRRVFTYINSQQPTEKLTKETIDTLEVYSKELTDFQTALSEDKKKIENEK